MLAIDLGGRTAVVTGGARGVGAGICKALASAGAKLVINSVSDSVRARELERELVAGGAEAIRYKADVTVPAEVTEMMRFTVEKFSSVDILVNNAGTSSVGSMESLESADIDRILNANVKGVFNCCKAVLPYMKSAGFGRIINIASTAMYTGGGGGAHYAASKAAAMGITRNLSKEYGGFGVTANALAISLIDTELFQNRYPNAEDREKAIAGVPVGRAGTPEDIGYAAAFLASPFGAYINGAILIVDGGRLYA